MSSPSPSQSVVCDRCGHANLTLVVFCERCGLPMGSAPPDAVAGRDALGSTEELDPELMNPIHRRVVHEFVARTGFEATPVPRGWRVTVDLPGGRHQVVYAGLVGFNRDHEPVLGLISICGPANDRDARRLLQINSATVDGHFAIKTLRGEDYFVALHNMTIAAGGAHPNPSRLVRHLAETADQLESRLSRGGDIF